MNIRNTYNIFMLSLSFLFLLTISSVNCWTLTKESEEMVTQIVPIYLSEVSYQQKDVSEDIQYYALSLENKSLAQNDALIISILSEYKTFVSIYINVVSSESFNDLQNNLPTASSAQIKCSDFNIISCPIINLESNTIILLAVLIKDPTTYILNSDLINVQVLTPFANGQTSNINLLQFKDTYAALFKIDLNAIKNQDQDNLFNEVVVKASYQSQMEDSYKKFIMRAAISKEGGQLEIIQNSEALGAYSQQIKLYNNPQQQFFVLITSENGLSLSLIFDQPDVQMEIATPLQYLYDMSMVNTIYQNDEFYFNTSSILDSWSQETINISFGVYVQKLSGAGIIIVSACDFIYEFTSQFGQSAYIVIPGDLLECVDPSIYIGLHNMTQKLGVRLIIQQYPTSSESDENQMLFLGEERVELVDTQCINYAIQPLFVSYTSQNMLIKYFSSSNNVELTLNTCRILLGQQTINCTALPLAYTTQSDNYQEYKYKSEQITNIKICPNQDIKSKSFNAFYSILAVPIPQVKTIKLENILYDVINSDQLILYKIDGALPKNTGQSSQATLQVRVKLINGDITFYKNCTLTPTYQEQGDSSFCTNNDDDSFRYQATYKLSEFKNENILDQLIFGIQALSQSLISINIYFENVLPDPDPPGPTPEPELLLLIDGINSLSLGSGPQVYYYKSHIIPYNITPSYELTEFYCVELFQSIQQLQSSSICSPTSNHLQSEQIIKLNAAYLRISLIDGVNTQDIPESVTLSINVPILTLQKNDHVVLSCLSFCYTQVKLNSFDGSERTYVTISGDGFINSTAGAYRNILIFDSPPYTFTATLPEGGLMFIQLSNQKPILAQKNKTTAQLKSQDQLNFIYTIKSYSSFAEVLINSFGSRLTGGWNLTKLNKSQQNIKSYSYPSIKELTDLPTQNYSTTATPLSLKNIKNQDETISSIPKQCYQSEQMVCFLAIRLNSQDSDFINDDPSIQISSNASFYFLYLNSPQIFTSDYSIVYFNPLILMNNQNTLFNITEPKVTIKPLSSCGTLSASLVPSDEVYLDSTEVEEENYVEVYTTQACTFVIGISSCELPMVFAGTPQKIYVNRSYSFLYALEEQTQQIQVQFWNNVTSADYSKQKPIMVSVYNIKDYNDCNGSKQQILVQELVYTDSQMYETKNKIKQIKITLQDNMQSNLFLITVDLAADSHYQEQELNVLITNMNNAGINLLPNQGYVPIFSKQSVEIFQLSHYTIANIWSVCYFTVSGSDVQGDITITVSDGKNQLINQNSQYSDVQNCLTIHKKDSNPSITNYKVTIEKTSSKSNEINSILWVKAEQYVQPIQINHGHSLYYEPEPSANSLVSTEYLNGQFGKCFNFDLTSFSNIAIIAFYFDYPIYINSSDASLDKSIPKLTVPGSKLVYNYSSIVSSRSNMTLGYKLIVNAAQLQETAITVCIRSLMGFYATIIDETSNYMVIFNEEINYRSMSRIQFLSLQVYKYIRFNASYLNINSGDQDAPKNAVVTEVTDCSNNTNNLTLLGSKSMVDIVLGNIAEFEQTFKNYSTQAALTYLNESNNYFIGIKSQADNIFYSIKMYQINGTSLPQSRWKLIGSQISVIQSENNEELIITLPQVASTQSNSTLKPNLKYEIYVLDKENQNLESLQTLVRCPTLNSVSFKNPNIPIMNVSAVNPYLPVMRLKISDLPNKNVTIMSKVTITQNEYSMPFTYFYNSQTFSIDNKENSSSSKPILVILFLISAGAIFLVILFKIVSKVIKKNSRNNIDFQLSDQNNPNNTAALPQPTPTFVPQNANVGYGQFVDQEVVV